MTRGEYQLKVAIEQALEVAEHLDEIETIVDVVLSTLSAGEYLIHNGQILSIFEADWIDESYGEWSSYNLYVEDNPV
jgi:hypothetical protein